MEQKEGKIVAMKTHYEKRVLERLKEAGYEVAGFSRNAHKKLHKANSADVIVPTKLNDRNKAKRLLKIGGLSL